MLSAECGILLVSMDFLEYQSAASSSLRFLKHDFSHERQGATSIQTAIGNCIMKAMGVDGPCSKCLRRFPTARIRPQTIHPLLTSELGINQLLRLVTGILRSVIG